MSKKFGVITIHGMGNQNPDYASALQNNLYEKLSGEIIRNLCFKSIWYHGGFQAHQDKVWENMLKSGRPLDQQWLRKFLLNFLSDAATSEFRPDEKESSYRRIQHTILRQLDALRIELGDQDQPVVIIAHSLGCQIISNYIWDAQHKKGIWQGRQPSEFQKLSTARLMITSGCNIPLFVSGLEKIEAIHKPNDLFKWYNYYDRDDILGWPLKPLSQGFQNAYDDVVSEDIEINTGWTPFSHSDYWKDDNFIAPVTDIINSFYGSL
ncbi:alpha/beta hydrolase [Pontibacter silvestris]|uniref:Alpha/beta hydrolase n=1 Tax=Pontibacter silvestris TaxID=2305183 RepID=A0ABW4X1U9_9BACT|nr:alpha/beta hydrolase [Pontibacter silvestris]MCC9136053.1 alpha/beta hydrolase [Pontibacter silvestris]